MTNRIYAFDVLKFIFAIVIAIFHLSWKYAPQGYLCVELFFAMTGFLMFLKSEKYQTTPTWQIWKNRLSSYYVYYLIFLFFYFMFVLKKCSLSALINSLFFLQFIGISEPIVDNILWFLGVYTYTYLVYLVLIQNVNPKIFHFVLPFAIYFSLVNMYAISPNQSIMWTYENEYRILGIPFCMWRGLTSIGIGFCMAQLINRDFNVPFVSLLIIFIFGVLCYIWFAGIGAKYDYFVSFIGSLLFILIYKNSKSAIVSVLNYVGYKFHYVCSLSLPIYIFHCLIIDILNKLNTPPQGYSPALYILWVVLMAVVMERIQKLILKEYHNISKRELHD